MTHHQDEGHYQADMNAQAQAEPEPRELTLGEKLVGITFNPSGDTEVQRAKELFALLSNLLIDSMDGKQISGLQKTMLDHALMEILNAQMNVVKVLTFKG